MSTEAVKSDETSGKPGNYKNLLTREILQRYSHLPSGQAAEAINRELDSDISDRTVRRYRVLLGVPFEPAVQRDIVIEGKKEKEDFDFTSLQELSDLMKQARTVVESKQREITVVPPYPDKWLGIAVFGDIHWGDYRIDVDMVLKHTEIVLNTPNLVAVQIGDLLEEQGSLGHRGKADREPPDELPLDYARKACAEWIRFIGRKLIAFITGNHDERSIKTELYDMGEELAGEIAGAYLGYCGYLKIKFPSGVDYNLYLIHESPGFSMYNPLHGAIRLMMQPRRQHIDGVVFGHLHAGAALIDLPIHDYDRVFGLRASGYSTWGSRYGWKINGIENQPGTPVILLNPAKRQHIVMLDFDAAVKLLEVLNG